jgi:hypothetical protein
MDYFPPRPIFAPGFKKAVVQNQFKWLKKAKNTSKLTARLRPARAFRPSNPFISR